MKTTSKGPPVLLRLAVLLVLACVLLVGCSSEEGASPTPEETPVGQALTAEGRLEPVSYVELSFEGGGQVAELLVQEGELVEAGTVLARLGDRERLENEVALAELGRLEAEQALEEVYRNAVVARAETEKELALAEKELALEEDDVEDLVTPPPQWHIDQAYANLVLAENQLVNARDDVAKMEKKLANQGSDRWWFISRKAFELFLKNMEIVESLAQRRYNDALEKYEDLIAPVDEIDLAVEEGELAVARARVAQLERELEALYEGPDPDDVAKGEAGLKAAKAELAAAQAALEGQELVAPFGGLVADLPLRQGEWAEGGQVVVVLADVSGWVVETDNLTEMEVPEVSVGQRVVVVPDALPELELSGNVVSISALYEEKRGDVTYTTTIDLGEDDPRLRWGMTVVVTFE